MLLTNLRFDWLQLKPSLLGESAIDLPHLHVKDKAQAKQFLFSYGYDYEDIQVREEIWRIYFEAVAFIRNHLLDEGEKIPPQYLSRNPHTDILKLLVEASISKESTWACPILRVMHIISHLDNDVRIQSFQYAREQIFNRFDHVIKKQGTSRYWSVGTSKDSVPVLRYIKKHRKERGSHIIKLLSKPEALAEGIYDSLGIRLVTENKLDAYRVLQKLFDFGVLCSTNIQPQRSTNTLIPHDILKERLELLQRENRLGRLSPQQLKKRLEKLELDYSSAAGFGFSGTSGGRNPFSSRWYRAIQFTGRQLISAPDPTYAFWLGIKAELENNKAASSVIRKIPITLRDKKTFFYPFEVQIMDRESYIESIGGRSRHREYKARQRLMARNRVLRDLV